jgi:hypothetical protein
MATTSFRRSASKMNAPLSIDALIAGLEQAREVSDHVHSLALA